MTAARYAQVVVEVTPDHLDRAFDYAIPDGVEVGVGQRVRVVFAGRRRTGWVVGTSDEPGTDPARIRPLALVQGERRWFDAEDLDVFRWVADRFCAPLAGVLRHALPARVAAVEAEAARWDPPAPVHAAPRPACPASRWRDYNRGGGASRLLRATAGGAGAAFYWRPLADDDLADLVADLVGRCLAAGRSALVLAPSPGSPLPDAALAVAGALGVDLRAGTDRERYRAFLRCRTGHARVAVGERGAVFAPLRDLGLVVVDDEASPAYKERRAPRHHAREVALARGRFRGAACVLVGDLPSAQAWRLLEGGHLDLVSAERRLERDRAPRVDVVDLADPRPGTRRARLASRTSAALHAAVRGGTAAVVLAARGGEGAALLCRACGRRRECPVCTSAVRVPRGDDGWACATCGWQGRAFACHACGATEAAPLAAGAGRLAAELARSHPTADVVRMEGFDAAGPTRRPAVAVMTRGSVVTRPSWLHPGERPVVVLPDADALLHRASFGAAEDALRLWFALGRWAERLVVQTADPGHAAVQALVRWDPEGFWRREAPRRAELRFPPAASLVRLSVPAEAALDLVADLRAALPAHDDVVGPDLEGNVLVKAQHLRGTLEALKPVRFTWSRARGPIRIDVDPVD